VVWTELDLILLELLDVWTVVELALLEFWLYGVVELMPDALYYGMRSNDCLNFCLQWVNYVRNYGLC